MKSGLVTILGLSFAVSVSMASTATRRSQIPQWGTQANASNISLTKSLKSSASGGVDYNFNILLTHAASGLSTIGGMQAAGQPLLPGDQTYSLSTVGAGSTGSVDTFTNIVTDLVFAEHFSTICVTGGGLTSGTSPAPTIQTYSSAVANDSFGFPDCSGSVINTLTLTWNATYAGWCYGHYEDACMKSTYDGVTTAAIYH